MASDQTESRSTLPGALLTTGLIAAYLVLAYYPYDWQLWQKPTYSNGVVRETNASLNFKTNGIALAPGTPEWLTAAIKTSSLQISLEVSSAQVQQPKPGPARIFTISRNPKNRNLTIAQLGPDLVVRLRLPETNSNAQPAIIVPGVFTDTQWRDIRIVIQPESLDIIVDGEATQLQLPANALNRWSTDFTLALGNEVAGNRPWLGTIRKAVVSTGDEDIDYLKPDALITPQVIAIPKHWRDLPRLQLIPFYRDSNARYSGTDLIINFLGFIPLGVLLAWHYKKAIRLIHVTALCASVSLCMELGQIMLPSRSTSVDDLILNALGGTFGAWLVFWRHG